MASPAHDPAVGARRPVEGPAGVDGEGSTVGREPRRMSEGGTDVLSDGVWNRKEGRSFAGFRESEGEGLQWAGLSSEDEPDERRM